jgi:outer membrane receptor protein involved in Fe transport
VTASQEFDNLSPEATITWQPTDDLLLFAAYKTAYKSGGFSNGGINSKFSNNPAGDLTFDEEEAEGFEAGIKATVLDNQLRLDLVAFSYDYKDLQIDFFNSPIFAFQTLTADAKTEGVEFEFEFAPYAVRGLNLRGSINYVDARYTDFDEGPCFAGQTIAQGCTLVNQIEARQNLTGEELSVAPDWTGTLGASYDRDIGDFRVGVWAEGRYSGEYLPSAFGNELSRQDDYIMLDAGLTFAAADGAWEVALLGKNLTDEFYVTGVVDGPSTGSGTGTANGVLADQTGFGNLPRTVKLQVTTRF